MSVENVKIEIWECEHGASVEWADMNESYKRETFLDVLDHSDCEPSEKYVIPASDLTQDEYLAGD